MRAGTVKTDDTFDRFYTENDNGSFALEATLDKNTSGLVQFPASGDGFGRYGGLDAGGVSKNPSEIVGEGDHYLKPETAAALFGVINELRKNNIAIDFGDMSSSNGSDPWQKPFAHHAGHGHNGKRSGKDLDFRYINEDGTSFQSGTATTDDQFSLSKNTLVYETAAKFGFSVNYQGTSGEIPNVTKVSNHNDHGHLGLGNSQKWKFVRNAPNQTIFQGILQGLGF